MALKAWLRPLVERALKRLPVSRFAYIQRDALQARLDAIEADARRQAAATYEAAMRAAVPTPPLYDPRLLETQVPVIGTLEERTLITMRCRDADVLPKVAGAGTVIREPDGTAAQIMHNGIKVPAGGYYGGWMQDLIARCQGHHEPQEEVLFTEVLRHLPGDATMIELGGFWSFYSVWFLSGDRRRRSLVVEADPGHLEVGRTTARLNGCAPVFVHAFVGAEAAPPAPFQTEASGVIELPCVSVASLLADHGIDRLDLLHCDAQGVEFTVIESCLSLAAAGRLDWLVISTHTHHISHDPLTHQRCLAALRGAGATILAEHDVQESFSGDGLIVARFGPAPPGWAAPLLSFNRASESLFRNPLYDLAQLSLAPPPAAPGPGGQLAMLEHSSVLATAGALVAITVDCALGMAGDRLLLPLDRVMFPAVVAHNGWGLETLQFLDQHLDPARHYALIDIGANVGLFSRQVALRHACVERILCVEADPGNFRALQYNLAGFGSERCALWNVALSDADGEMRFFRDRENFGNYSLNDDAMRDRPFDAIVVRAAETGDWMRRNIVALEHQLIWKSDTQGYDELIISRTPMEIWAQLDAAIVELWRIRKPAFDRAAFIERLDHFANLAIELAAPCTTADVLAYLDSTDWDHADLYLWR